MLQESGSPTSHYSSFKNDKIDLGRTEKELYEVCEGLNIVFNILFNIGFNIEVLISGSIYGLILRCNIGFNIQFIKIGSVTANIEFVWWGVGWGEVVCKVIFVSNPT